MAIYRHQREREREWVLISSSQAPAAVWYWNPETSWYRSCWLGRWYLSPRDRWKNERRPFWQGMSEGTRLWCGPKSHIFRNSFHLAVFVLLFFRNFLNFLFLLFLLNFLFRLFLLNLFLLFDFLFLTFSQLLNSSFFYSSSTTVHHCNYIRSLGFRKKKNFDWPIKKENSVSS